MKDYNFFSVYDKKRSIDFDPKSLYFISAMMLLLSIAVALGFVGRNMYLDFTINKTNLEIEKIIATEEYKESDRLQKSISAMEEYDTNAEIAFEKFKAANLLGTEIMMTISSALPTNVTISSMQMNNATASITLNTPDRKSAAETIENLKNTNLFKEIHMSSISSSKSGVGYISDLDFIMEEGAKNEE